MVSRRSTDLPSAAADLRTLATRLEDLAWSQSNEAAAEQRRRFDELQDAYDALSSRYLHDTGDGEEARRRFAMVLAQAVNAEALMGRAPPPPSFGARIGGLIDLAVYGAAYAVGLRRPVAAARLRLALIDNWPGLFDWIQLRRGRPTLDRQRVPLESVVFEEGHDEDRGVLTLSNLFVRRETRDVLRRVSRTLMGAVSDHGPVTHLYALNFCAGGGAEMVTEAYARVAARAGGTVAILLTDAGPRVPMKNLPDNVVVLDAGGTHASGLSDDDRRTLTYLIWRTADPGLFHIINSDAAWRMVTRTPRALLPAGRIAASIFALQFDGSGKPVGYAAQYLPAASETLDVLLTDNQRFADEGPDRVEARIEPVRRRVAPTPCRLYGEVSEADAIARLAKRTATRTARTGRPTIVWAGRLDREKRIDILYDVAKAMADRADFLVFGQSVVDRHDIGERLAALPNVRMMGFYANPLAWDAGTAPDAFLFTSVWEGMPNTVIEAGWLGLPVVASDVGGVRDLIDAGTGWAIGADAGSEAYVAALDTLLQSPKEARRRTTALVKRVHARHTPEAFAEAIETAYAATRARERSR